VWKLSKQAIYIVIECTKESGCITALEPIRSNDKHNYKSKATITMSLQNRQDT